MESIDLKAYYILSVYIRDIQKRHSHILYLKKKLGMKLWFGTGSDNYRIEVIQLNILSEYTKVKK